MISEEGTSEPQHFLKFVLLIEFACLFSVIIQIRNVCPMTGFEYITLMAVKQIPVRSFRFYLIVY